MKYELTSETRILITGLNRHVLHRIKALEDFGRVKAGDLGGFIEKEDNLSQEGECWIYDEACVFGNARVQDNSEIKNTCVIYGEAVIKNHAIISGNCQISDKTVIEGYPTIGGTVRIWGNVHISDYACIKGNIQIANDVVIENHSHIIGYGIDISNGTYIKEYSFIEGYAICIINSLTTDDIRIIGCNIDIKNGRLYDRAKIKSNTVIDDIAINEHMTLSDCTVTTDIKKDIKKNLLYQTGLVANSQNKVIAYKEVNDDFSSAYDNSFIYKVGEYAICEDYADNNESCAKGLHFSNPKYWNGKIENSRLLIAEIDLDDIITIQDGKIRCKKAFILDSVKL